MRGLGAQAGAAHAHKEEYLLVYHLMGLYLLPSTSWAQLTSELTYDSLVLDAQSWPVSL